MFFTIVMASKGQRQAQWWHPVQALTSTNCDRLSQPTRSSTNTCGAQAAMQRPQPVQRPGSILGR